MPDVEAEFLIRTGITVSMLPFLYNFWALKAFFTLEYWETIEPSVVIEMFCLVLSSVEALATHGC